MSKKKESQFEIDIAENSAISIAKNYFNIHMIEAYFNEDDKIPNIDGFIRFDNKDYNVQIKGTSKSWEEHKIDRKYFEYALSNYILYIIVDNIDVTKGIHSKNYRIYYKTIDSKDAIEGLKNKTKMSASKFEFKELNDISEFKKFVYDSYNEYSNRESKGIEISAFFLKGYSDMELSGKIFLEDNLVDIKKISIDRINLPNICELKIDQDSFADVKINDIIEKKTVYVPDTNIKLVVKKNKISRMHEIEYEEFKILYNAKTGESKITISDFYSNPFNVDVYENYKMLIEKVFVLNKTNEKFKSIIRFIDDLIKFKNYLVSKELYKEKYNKPDVLDFFYRVYSYGLQYQDKRPGILFNKINNEFIAISNQKKQENYILPQMVKLELVHETENLRFEGYTVIFTQEIADNYRKCLNFDYIELLKEDQQNLAEIYLDEQVSMIIFNYLLIYWEYNHSAEMIRILLETVEKRISKTENNYLIINYMQMKKVLALDYSKEELVFLAQENESDDIFVKLATSILLQRKLEAIDFYCELKEEEKEKFDNWPLKHLYDELIE